MVGRIAHVLDDGRQEKRERIDGAEPGDTDQHVDVYLPVSERLEYVTVCECVGQVAVVGGEAALNFITLGGGEEFGSVGFVLALPSSFRGWLSE